MIQIAFESQSYRGNNDARSSDSYQCQFEPYHPVNP